MRSPWSEHKTELVVGTLLRWGVIVSGGVVALGGIVYLARYGSLQPDYHIFRGESHHLTTLPGIIHDTLTWHRRGLLQFGLVMLILTPIARVALTAGVFLLQRDRLYIVVTLFVLAILLYSLFSPA